MHKRVSYQPQAVSFVENHWIYEAIYTCAFNRGGQPLRRFFLITAVAEACDEPMLNEGCSENNHSNKVPIHKRCLRLLKHKGSFHRHRKHAVFRDNLREPTNPRSA